VKWVKQYLCVDLTLQKAFNQLEDKSGVNLTVMLKEEVEAPSRL
jgi:hypothetical protein